MQIQQYLEHMKILVPKRTIHIHINHNILVQWNFVEKEMENKYNTYLELSTKLVIKWSKKETDHKA